MAFPQFEFIRSVVIFLPLDLGHFLNLLMFLHKVVLFNSGKMLTNGVLDL